MQVLTLHMAFDGPDYFSAVEPSCNSFKNVLRHSREKKLCPYVHSISEKQRLDKTGLQVQSSVAC